MQILSIEHIITLMISKIFIFPFNIQFELKQKYKKETNCFFRSILVNKNDRFQEDEFNTDYFIFICFFFFLHKSLYYFN